MVKKTKYPREEISKMLMRTFSHRFKEMSLNAVSKKELREQIHYLFNQIRWGGEDEVFYEFQGLLITWALLEVNVNDLIEKYWDPKRSKKLREKQKKENEVYKKMENLKIYKKGELPQ